MINKKTISSDQPQIYRYSDYIKYLKVVIQNNDTIYGYKAKIAESAQCQRSHLSLVLGGRAHFTPEQAVGVADFLGLSWKEKNYFLLLIQYARAGTQGLKLFVKTQMEEHLKAQEDFSQRITEKMILPDVKSAIVYSSWEPLAILIALSSPRLRTPAALAERLQLKKVHVEKVLQQLQEVDLVENHGSEWRAVEKNIHVPKASRFNSLNHSHWRQKAVQNSFLQNEAIHYTSVCTLSKSDAQKMKEMLLEFIDRGRDVIAPSKEEELYCLTCDWFRV